MACVLARSVRCTASGNDDTRSIYIGSLSILGILHKIQRRGSLLSFADAVFQTAEPSFLSELLRNLDRDDVEGAPHLACCEFPAIGRVRPRIAYNDLREGDRTELK